MGKLLSADELAFFHEEGYLVAKDIIPAPVIHRLQDEIDEVIEAKAQELLAAGKITKLHADKTFLYRATEIAKECNEILAPVTSGSHCGPAIFALITCPDLLDVMEQLLGPEVVASSVYRVRPKLPDRPEGIVPWHQDSGYFHTMGDKHLIVTCWVPLMDATVEAGCMEVLPKSHRHGVVRHFNAITKAPSLTVHPDHLPEGTPVAVPASIGDAVLMTNVTCHRSTANLSGKIRWATDLRYNAPEAGNYFPYEAGFLARSKEHPDQIVTDCNTFRDLRLNHQPQGKVDRSWLHQNDETFSNPL